MTEYLSGIAVTDTEFNVVRYISDHKVYTIAGDEKVGYKDGNSVRTAFNGPTGLATDEEGNLYVADTQNNVIRKISTTGEVTTFAGTTKEGYKDGNVDVADSFAGLVYSLNDALAQKGNNGVGADIFKDVTQNDWFFKAVMFMQEKGLISGVGDGAFAPNMNMTRGMFVTVVGRICEAEGETIANNSCEFSDVAQDMYYAKYVQWAQPTGLTKTVSLAAETATCWHLRQQPQGQKYLRFS